MFINVIYDVDDDLMYLMEILLTMCFGDAATIYLY